MSRVPVSRRSPPIRWLSSARHGTPRRLQALPTARHPLPASRREHRFQGDDRPLRLARVLLGSGAGHTPGHDAARPATPTARRGHTRAHCDGGCVSHHPDPGGESMRRLSSTRLACALVTGLLGTAGASAVLAQDLAPRAYVITPARSNVVTLGFAYNEGDLPEFFSPDEAVTGTLSQTHPAGELPGRGHRLVPRHSSPVPEGELRSGRLHPLRRRLPGLLGGAAVFVGRRVQLTLARHTVRTPLCP